MADVKTKSQSQVMAYLKVALYIPVALYALLFFYALFFSNGVIFAPHTSSYKDSAETLKFTTRDGSTISAVYLHNEQAPYTILFSHGNSEDIGDLLPQFERIKAMGFSVLGYDYHGYGTSGGKPSEANVYQDIDAAYSYLTQTRGVAPGKIIAMGRSLGGGAATDLAARAPLGGLVLESTFTSAFRVLTYVPLLPFDKFDNIGKIGRVKCPVLILHGDADTVIPIYHGHRLFAAANESKRMIVVQGAGHNNLSKVAGPAYEKHLRELAESISK